MFVLGLTFAFSVKGHFDIGKCSVKVVLFMSGDIIIITWRIHAASACALRVSQGAERARELRSRLSGLAASSECLSGRLGLLLGSAASRWDNLPALEVSSPFGLTC